jgi:hypothetical protein
MHCAAAQLQVVMGAIVYGSVMNLEAQFYRYEVGAEVSNAVHTYTYVTQATVQALDICTVVAHDVRAMLTSYICMQK